MIRRVVRLLAESESFHKIPDTLVPRGMTMGKMHTSSDPELSLKVLTYLLNAPLYSREENYPLLVVGSTLPPATFAEKKAAFREHFLCILRQQVRAARVTAGLGPDDVYCGSVKYLRGADAFGWRGVSESSYRRDNLGIVSARCLVELCVPKLFELDDTDVFCSVVLGLIKAIDGHKDEVLLRLGVVHWEFPVAATAVLKSRPVAGVQLSGGQQAALQQQWDNMVSPEALGVVRSRSNSAAQTDVPPAG